MQIIERKFYEKDTIEVAKNLLGKTLCRRDGDKIYRGKIVETEAYKQEDEACHAFRGKTKRAKTLFEKAGTVYVYLIYGMYHCVNIVTEAEDYGSAVLIRALEPIDTILDTNGPAKLCRAMNITRDLNEVDATDSNSPVWIESGEDIPSGRIIQTTRIGIKVAVDYPWRFYIKGNKWVSKIDKAAESAKSDNAVKLAN